MFLSKREAKELERVILNRWGKIGVEELGLEKKVQVDEDKWLILGKHILTLRNEFLAPFVGDEELCRLFPYVIVDMGAIKYITNGANVMRPGIRAFPTNFAREDIVIVKDERYGKPIAVCSAILSKNEAESVEKGAILKNISYVGDKFWNTYKELTFTKR